MVNLKPVGLFLCSLLFFLAGCLGPSIQKDLVLPKDFQPQNFERLAVMNLDPVVQFSPYVEAELIRKGYRVKEGSMVRQLLKKEGFSPESLDLRALAQIGTLLDVQGVVLCSVLEFSRFRDSYRVSIRMVVPRTGETVWSAQGAIEGARGEKSGALLNQIAISCLKELPAVKRQEK
jgi:hypothetical protein